MPTLDRKPRARRRTTYTDTLTSKSQLHAIIRETANDADAWAAARPRVVRYLAARSGEKTDIARRIADAYHKKPYLLPALPPQGVNP